MKRSAFSLIEIMIVIAIITILLAAAFFGFNAVLNGRQMDATRAKMGVIRSITNEYMMGTNGGSNAVPSWKWNGPVMPPATITTLSLNFWSAPYRWDNNLPPNGIDNSDPGEPMTAPADAKDMALWQWSNAQLAQTQLSRLPASKTMITGLPSGTAKVLNANQAPFFLDNWDVPILFVPGSGLKGVIIGGQPANGNPDPIKSPDGKPFFASAGPDGNFTTGDDNIYSFDN